MASESTELIPWDPNSEQHVERMTTQRLACGWRADEVPEWKEKQLKGMKFMYWIVPVDNLDGRDKLLESHFAQFDYERSPLKDTTDKMLTPRTPTNRDFFPVGHVALEKKPDLDATLKLPTGGVYWVTSLYVSWAIQAGGFGRSAMRQVEKIACEEPFLGKLMVLDTVRKELQLSPAAIESFYTGRGIPIPAVVYSNEEWYSRQGYEIFHRDEKGFIWVHPVDGVAHVVPLIYLKKSISK